MMFRELWKRDRPGEWSCRLGLVVHTKTGWTAYRVGKGPSGPYRTLREAMFRVESLEGMLN